MRVHLDEHRCDSHQIWKCFVVMSQSKEHLKQMIKDLTEEVERWDLEPALASFWWSSTHADEIREHMDDGDKKGLHDLEVHIHLDGATRRKVWKIACKWLPKLWW